LRASADIAYERLLPIKGLHPLKATAGFFMMVQLDMEQFPEIKDDTEFCKLLLDEQCAITLPGKCFFLKENAFRMSTCTSIEKIEAFAARIKEFCAIHGKKE
jgi:aspartate/methionine/tyrosine aminotransferase